MKLTSFKKILIILLVMISLPSIASTGYSYWDNSNTIQSETIGIGEWSYYLVNYDFSTETVATLVADGALTSSTSNWDTSTGSLVNTNRKANFFFPINSNEYTITTNVEIDATWGEYGIFFDSIVPSNVSKDEGYILKFSPSSNDGSISIYERSRGRDARNPSWIVTSSSSAFLPSVSADPTWWTSAHTIELNIVETTATTKTISVYIDSDLIGSWTYTYTASATYYTGYYVYNGTASIHYLTVE